MWGTIKFFPWKTSLGGICESLAQWIFPHIYSKKYTNIVKDDNCILKQNVIIRDVSILPGKIFGIIWIQRQQAKC